MIAGDAAETPIALALVVVPFGNLLVHITFFFKRLATEHPPTISHFVHDV